MDYFMLAYWLKLYNDPYIMYQIQGTTGEANACKNLLVEDDRHAPFSSILTHFVKLPRDIRSGS